MLFKGQRFGVSVPAEDHKEERREITVKRMEKRSGCPQRNLGGGGRTSQNRQRKTNARRNADKTTRKIRKGHP